MLCTETLPHASLHGDGISPEPHALLLLPLHKLWLCRTNSAFAALQMTHDLNFDAETYGKRGLAIAAGV